MFTGLVQAVGRLVRIAQADGGVSLAIDPGAWKHVPARGDSISVSGCCLTVTAAGRGWGAGVGGVMRGVGGMGGRKRVIEFFVVPETLRRTTLGAARVGAMVNLEHAATPATLLGGHLVQGHVDGVARVAKVTKEGEWRVWVELPGDELAAYVVPKGSVCVDGVSLTVAGLWKKGRVRGFEIALIPETLERTTLAGLEVGVHVNIETDLVVKAVVHWASRAGLQRRVSRAKRPRTRTGRR